MDIVSRARNIITRPAREWQVIASEPGSGGGLVAGYVAPLAAIAPLASFVGLCIVGVGVPFIGTYRTGFATGIAQAIFAFVVAILGIFVLATIVNAFATGFAGQKNFAAALKVAAYSYTPAFVAGIFLVFPPAGILTLVAGLYGIYLLYVGLPVMMRSPRERAPLYTIAVVVCAMVVGFAFGVVTVVGRMGYSYATTGSPFGVDQTSVSGDQAKNIAAAIVGNAAGGGDKNQRDAQALVDSVASAAADADKAGDRGDSSAQAAAGINILKGLVTGGKSVTVVPREQLAALLPESIADMPRGDARSESGEFAGIKSSKASALYKDANRSVEVEIGDLGNAGGLALLANAAAKLSSHEDDNGYEKTVDRSGMNVHEEWTNAGKHSELFAIVDNRWALGVTGDGVEMDDAVKDLEMIDVSKLQALESAK